MGIFSSVLDGVKSAAKAVVNTARSVAKKVVSFVAEKGDKIVEGVKKTWKTVKNVVRGVAVAAKAAAPILSFFRVLVLRCQR